MNREDWLADCARRLNVLFQSCNKPIPPNVRISCGFPAVRAISRKNKRVGECWSSSCSSDGTFEIFISPVLSDALEVCHTLAHELVHAVVGTKCGHKKPFADLAKGIGLTGKMTCTVPGPEFKEWFTNQAFDPYPHSSLNAYSDERKKQSTRLLKAECNECGYTCRVTRKWVDEAGPPHCPQHGEMEVQ